MSPFLYRCPNTGDNVQAWTADDPEDDDLTYVQVTCLACAQAHLVNPKTGKVLGALKTNRCAEFYAFTQRVLSSYGAIGLSVSFFKSGDGGRTPQFIPQRRTRRSRLSAALRSVTRWTSAAGNHERRTGVKSSQGSIHRARLPAR
jgi:hypothetical protein